MNKPKSAKERKALERKGKRSEGLVPKEVWIKAGRDEALRKAVDKINR